MQTSLNSPAVLFWAILRLILGIGQMAGAIASAVLLFRLGAAFETIVTLSATMGLTVSSLFLFRVLRVQGKKHS